MTTSSHLLLLTRCISTIIFISLCPDPGSCLRSPWIPAARWLAGRPLLGAAGPRHLLGPAPGAPRHVPRLHPCCPIVRPHHLFWQQHIRYGRGPLGLGGSQAPAGCRGAARRLRHEAGGRSEAG